MQKSKRMHIILEYIKKHKDIQIAELTNIVDASESTIRRDIKDLSLQGLVIENYGSVLYHEKNEPDVFLRERISLNLKEKQDIGLKAASLISDGSFVYIDAGSTTLQMIPFIQAKHVVFITNGLNIATELIKFNHEVHILGGQIKAMTAAVIGQEAIEALENYHFDLAFMGTNGISDLGYSTPDIKEGLLKKKVIQRSRKSYVLSDQSKFGKTTSFVFAKTEDAELISNT